MVSESQRKVNWWLLIGGLLLVVCGSAILVAPGFFLEFLTVWAGAGFLVSGVAGLVSYFRLRKVMDGAGWTLFNAVLDILLGVLLILHPLAFADVIPWILGIMFLAFGVLEIAGIMPFARAVPETRVIAIISGVLCVLVGIMFIVWPASLSIWVAAFAIVRGITLVANGFIFRG